MSTQPSDGQLLDARPGLPLHPLAVGASILYNLILATDVADTSPGVNVIGFKNASVELTGSATGSISVQMEGSCSVQNPDVDGSAWSSLDSAITTKGISSLSLNGIRWVRAVMAGNPSGGTINVNLSAVG